MKPTINQILAEGLKENIIIKVNDYLYSFIAEAEEDNIEHFLCTLLHYYGQKVAILRNEDEVAIGLFIAQ